MCSLHHVTGHVEVQGLGAGSEGRFRWGIWHGGEDPVSQGFGLGRGGVGLSWWRLHKDCFHSPKTFSTLKLRVRKWGRNPNSREQRTSWQAWKSVLKALPLQRHWHLEKLPTRPSNHLRGIGHLVHWSSASGVSSRKLPWLWIYEMH